MRWICNLNFYHGNAILNFIVTWICYNLSKSVILPWDGHMYIYHEMVWFFTVAKSKLDETCFVVISSESTQTHSKVLNWVAIQIWKIKYRKHVNSLLQHSTVFKLVVTFGHVKNWFRFRSKNKVCCTQLKLQLLLKVKLYI